MIVQKVLHDVIKTTLTASYSILYQRSYQNASHKERFVHSRDGWGIEQVG